MIALTNTLACSRKNANMSHNFASAGKGHERPPRGRNAGSNPGEVGRHDPTHSRKGAGSLGLLSSYRHAHKDQRLRDPQSNIG